MASGNNSVAISHSAAGPSTMRWSAPELYGDNALFTQETDVWGYGMVLYVRNHALARLLTEELTVGYKKIRRS